MEKCNAKRVRCSHKQIGNYRLVDPPIGTKPIGFRWRYKNMYKENGSLEKHKERLIAKGYAKKEGVYYT